MSDVIIGDVNKHLGDGDDPSMPDVLSSATRRTYVLLLLLLQSAVFDLRPSVGPT